MTTTTETATTRYTACFTESGTPYYPETATFATEAELRADLDGVSEDGHWVDLGTVELDENGGVRWATWQLLDKVWVGYDALETEVAR